MIKHEALFGVRGDWRHLEAGYGKGDDVGDATKRPADEAISGGVA